MSTFQTFFLTGGIVAGFTLASSAQHAGPQFTGSAGEASGFAVAKGDIDDDGLTDLVVGAPGATGTYPGGHVEIHWGSGATATVLSAPASNYEFGFALAVGDVNGTAGDELVVGAPGAGSQAGVHYLYDYASFGTPWNATYTGVGASGDRLGTSVTILPSPFSGGSANAWAAGAPLGEIGGGTAQQGYIDVHSGSTGAVIATFGPPAAGSIVCFLATLTSGRFHFGRHIVGGDFDGDGLGDIATTNWYRLKPASTCTAGNEYRIYASDGSTPYTYASPWVLQQIPGWADSDILQLASIGNVDATSGEELVIAFGNTQFSANDTVQILSPNGGAGAGWALDSISDFVRVNADDDIDADGLRDIVVFGESPKTVTWLASSDGTIYEMAEQSISSGSVSSLVLGDFTQEGWVDLAIGDAGGNVTTVYTPNDPTKGLSILGSDGVSVDEDERLAIYIDGGVSGMAPGDYYGMVGSTALAPPNALVLFGQTFEIANTAFVATTLTNPNLMIADNNVPVDGNSLFQSRKTIPADALSTTTPFYLYWEYIAYTPSLSFYATSNAFGIQFLP